MWTAQLHFNAYFTLLYCVVNMTALSSGMTSCKALCDHSYRTSAFLLDHFLSWPFAVKIFHERFEVICVKRTACLLFLHLFLPHPLETFTVHFCVKRLTPDICWALISTQQGAASIHLCYKFNGITGSPHPSFLSFECCRYLEPSINATGQVN